MSNKEKDVNVILKGVNLEEIKQMPHKLAVLEQKFSKIIIPDKINKINIEQIIFNMDRIEWMVQTFDNYKIKHDNYIEERIIKRMESLEHQNKLSNELFEEHWNKIVEAHHKVQWFTLVVKEFKERNERLEKQLKEFESVLKKVIVALQITEFALSQSYGNELLKQLEGLGDSKPDSEPLSSVQEEEKWLIEGFLKKLKLIKISLEREKISNAKTIIKNIENDYRKRLE